MVRHEWEAAGHSGVEEFEIAEYEEYIQNMFGVDNQAWLESQKRVKKFTKADWEKNGKEWDAICRDLAAELGTPDLVVVNPPRKGLSDSTRDLLVTLAPPTLIYVSCGPESLGRDLAVLAAHGWTADTIEPFDLMPGTAQVETIVRLRR